MAVFGEVDGTKIGATGVAAFGANLRELRGDKDRELGFVSLAATGTENAAEVPFGGAKGTEQCAFGAVAFGAKHTN